MDSSAIQPLRDYANAHALDEQSIMEAKRVARKRVVMKKSDGARSLTGSDLKYLIGRMQKPCTE